MIYVTAFSGTSDASYDNLRCLSDFNIGVQSSYTKPSSRLLFIHQHLRSYTRKRCRIDWKMVSGCSGHFLYDVSHCPFPTHRSYLQVISFTRNKINTQTH